MVQITNVCTLGSLYQVSHLPQQCCVTEGVVSIIIFSPTGVLQYDEHFPGVWRLFDWTSAHAPFSLKLLHLDSLPENVHLTHCFKHCDTNAANVL